MRVVVRQAHGGEFYTIPALAWPYFENQGFVITEYIDDDSQIPPFYLTAAESDARYAEKGSFTPVVVHGDDDTVARPVTLGPVIWFGSVDPLNADDTQDVTVYVSDDDGTGGGGGGGGGVSFTGDAVDVDYDPTTSGLSGSNVQAALDEVVTSVETGLAGKATAAEVQALIDAALATTPMYHFPTDWTAGTVAARPATTRPVHWFVPAAYSLPTTGTTAGGTIASVDELDIVTRY